MFKAQESTNHYVRGHYKIPGRRANGHLPILLRATLDDEGNRNTNVANRDQFLHINVQRGVKRLLRQFVPVSGTFPGRASG